MRDSIVILILGIFLLWLAGGKRGKMMYLVFTGQEDKIATL